MGVYIVLGKCDVGRHIFIVIQLKHVKKNENFGMNYSKLDAINEKIGNSPARQ
jgi:hypothetical protein